MAYGKYTGFKGWLYKAEHSLLCILTPSPHRNGDHAYS